MSASARCGHPLLWRGCYLLAAREPCGHTRRKALPCGARALRAHAPRAFSLRRESPAGTRAECFTLRLATLAQSDLIPGGAARPTRTLAPSAFSLAGLRVLLGHSPRVLLRLAALAQSDLIPGGAARPTRTLAPSAFSLAGLRVLLGHSPRVLLRLAALGVLLASLRSANLFLDDNKMVRGCKVEFANCPFFAFKVLKIEKFFFVKIGYLHQRF